MRKIFLFILFVGFSFMACLEDHTNLDYKDIILPDSVTLTNLNTGDIEECSDLYAPRFTLRAGEELQLEANAVYHGEDSLIYEWRFGHTTVGYGKQLKCTVTENVDAAYICVHRANGESAVMCAFTVTVLQSWTSGFAIAGQNEGKVVLDFVDHYSYKDNVEWQGTVIPNFALHAYEPMENVYEMMNNGEVLGTDKPMLIRRIADYSGNSTLFILDEEWQKSVSLNGTTMQKVVTLGEEFVTVPDNLDPVNFVSIGFTDVIQNKTGELYTRINYDNGTPNTGRFSSQPLAYKDPNDPAGKNEVVKATMIVADNFKPFGLVYEEQKNRFLIFATSHRENLIDYNQFFTLTSSGQNVPNYVELDNFENKEVITILAPVGKLASVGMLPYSIIFRDKETDMYYWQTFILKINNDFVTPYVFTYTPKACVPLSFDVVELLKADNVKFYINPNLKVLTTNDIFFSSGNALYQLTANGQSANMLCRFNDRTAITDFAIAEYWYSDRSSGWDRYFNGRVFGAVVDNEDFFVIKLSDDPFSLVGIEPTVLWNKHYDGGVKALYYY